jgi:hypothetical protein
MEFLGEVTIIFDPLKILYNNHNKEEVKLTRETTEREIDRKCTILQIFAG